MHRSRGRFKRLGGQGGGRKQPARQPQERPPTPNTPTRCTLRHPHAVDEEEEAGDVEQVPQQLEPRDHGWRRRVRENTDDWGERKTGTLVELGRVPRYHHLSHPLPGDFAR